MSHGSAAQVLCILEALTDSNRRILISSAPTASDLSAESDLIDVYVELFMAAHEIIGGSNFRLLFLLSFLFFLLIPLASLQVSSQLWVSGY
jgi:hypothetical protein